MSIDYFFFSLLLCVAVFVQKLRRKEHFLSRLFLSCIGIFSIGTLCSALNHFIIDSVLIPAQTGTVASRILIVGTATINYVVWLVLFMIGIHCTFKVTRKQAITVATSGYALQNAIYFAIMIISCWSDWLRIEDHKDWVVVGIYFLICVALCCIARLSCFKHIDTEPPTRFSVCFILGVVLISIALSLNVPAGREYTVNYVYGLLLNLLLIFLQIFLLALVDKQKEIEIFDNLLVMEKRQHALTRETVETINLKCHDIRHQVAVLYTTAMTSEGKRLRQESLQEIQNCISIYETVTNTGNEMVDIILMEKGLLCERYGIQLSHIIDGAKLSFMNSLDVCCLFANALDNAIECTGSEPEEKRVIIVHVSVKGNMLSIHFENCCSHPVQFVNGRPETSKEDRLFHGFGTKSIETIVNKYGGNLTMEWTGDMFVTDILFVLDETGQPTKV